MSTNSRSVNFTELTNHPWGITVELGPSDRLLVSQPSSRFRKQFTTQPYDHSACVQSRLTNRLTTVPGLPLAETWLLRVANFAGS